MIYKIKSCVGSSDWRSLKMLNKDKNLRQKDLKLINIHSQRGLILYTDLNFTCILSFELIMKK